MDLEDLERTLRDRLHAPGPVPRATLRHFLSLPDHERARRIGVSTAIPEPGLLIDLERLTLMP